MSRRNQKSTRDKGKTAGKSAVFARRLVAYSATAGAAIACATEARADLKNIDSTNLIFNGTAVGPSNMPVVTWGASATAFETFKFDGLVNRMGGSNAGGSAQARMTGWNAATSNHTFVVARKFDYGVEIDKHSHVFRTGGEYAMLYVKNHHGLTSGKFGKDSRTGYVGFKFERHSVDYYGWLNVKVNFDGGLPDKVSLVPVTGDIYGAYGRKDDHVTAGEYSAVPEPSTSALGGLALLACGAAGVRELRRRRKESCGIESTSV